MASILIENNTPNQPSMKIDRFIIKLNVTNAPALLLHIAYNLQI